ncbi:hypothetical protein ACFVH6_25705 [Spirillospora sp. NPDC127200]
MAGGPGGKEAGRLTIRVTPDTSGFTAKVEKVVAKADAKKIDIEVDAKTADAEAALDAVSRDRDLKIKVKLEHDEDFVRQLNELPNERQVKVVFKTNALAVKERIDSVNAALRDRDLHVKYDLENYAQVATAVEALDKQLQDKTSKIKVHLDESAAATARETLAELSRDRAVRLDVGVDDIASAKASLAELSKLRRVKLAIKLVGDKPAMKRLLQLTKTRTARINIDLRGYGDAKVKLDRLAKDRSVKFTAVANTKGAESQFKRLTRRRNAQVTARLNDKAAKRKLNELARPRKAEVKVSADQVSQATRQIDRAAQDRKIRIRYDGEQARRQLDALTRGKVASIDVKLDEARAAAKLRVLSRDRTVELHVDVDRDNLKDITRWIGRLGPDFADAGRRVKRAFDGFNEIGDGSNRKFGLLRKTLGGVMAVGLGGLMGLTRALGTSSQAAGQLGEVMQGAMQNLTSFAGKGTSALGGVAGVIAQVVASLIGFGVALAVITAVINTIGALVVAAIGAVAAIGSVVVGALALVALPAIFAGIAAAIAMASDRQGKLRQQFSDLKKTITSTFSQAAKPMLSFFASTLERANKALKVGTPLYKQLTTAFTLSTKALTPLRSGLASFTREVLFGFNDALKNITKNGTMNVMAAATANLGNVIGRFARNLSQYGPQFATGFNALVLGLHRIGDSLSRWMGAFAAGSPAVIQSFAKAFGDLFDVFANNASTYTTAASALGKSVSIAAPGIQKLAAAFAAMAPGIFDSLASAINGLGDAVSDEGTVRGLTAITQAVIGFAGSLANLATNLTGWMGGIVKDHQNWWNTLRGQLKDQKAFTVKELSDLIGKQGSLQGKISAGFDQLARSLQLSSRSVAEEMLNYARHAERAMEQVEGSTGKHLQTLAGQMHKLVDQWKDAGGKVGPEWQKQWDALGNQIKGSGNTTLQQYKGLLDGMLQKSTDFRTRWRQTLIDAFKAEGIEVDAGMLARIDQALGLMTQSAQQQSAASVNAIQANFSRLPGLLQQAMTEAKTPEQLRTKLQAITQVMDEQSGAIATAFGKLPTAMQKTLTESTAVFNAWSGMETFKQKITAGAGEVGTAMAQMSTWIWQNLNASNNHFTSLSSGVTTFKTSIAGLGSAVSAAAAPLSTLGVNGVWASGGVRQVGDASNSAWSGLQGMSGALGAVSGWLGALGGRASSAVSSVTQIGTAATTAGRNMGTFGNAVQEHMGKASQAANKGAQDIKGKLSPLPQTTASYGRLSGFVSSIQSSMSQALGAVRSAVSEMNSLISSLNRTVTTRVNIVKSESTQPSSAPTPRGFTANGLAEPMAAVTPFATPQTQLDVQAAGTSSALAGWRNLATTAAREGRKNRTTVAGPEKVYNVTIQAAPTIPTEHQIVKQLRFADALYG